MCDFFDDPNLDVSPQEPEPLYPSFDIKDIERGDDLCINEKKDLTRNWGDRIAKCAARLPLTQTKKLLLFVQHDGYPQIDFGILRGGEKTNKINIDGVRIKSSRNSAHNTFNFLWGDFSERNTLATPFAKIVVNKSSQIVVSNKDTSLIDKILAEGDWKYAAIVLCSFEPEPIPAVFSSHDIVTWLTFLKSVIPVYLVCEADMPDSPVPVEFSESETKDEIVPDDFEIMEWLGLYHYKGDKREIWLCPERIKDTAQRLKIPFEHLFAIVYIHELGHAALDSTIDIDKKKNIDGTLALKVTGDRKGNSSRFEYVMEESLANMIMLQYMDWYSEIKENESFWESAESFVKKQRPAYSYGLTLLKDNVDWQLWRNNRCHVDTSKESKWLEVFESIMNPLKRVKAYNNLFNKI